MNFNLRFFVLVALSIGFFASIWLTLPTSSALTMDAESDDKVALENRENASRANTIGVATLEEVNHKESIRYHPV